MEPRDLLKKLHPNQFSDSKIIDKIECPRELLDFHLSKLSEQNKHFDKKMNNKTNLSKFTDNSSMFTLINSPI